MKIIMKLVLILFLLTITIKTANSANFVYMSQNDTSGNGVGESIFIKQQGNNNKVGTSMTSGSEDYFDIYGNNLTISIKQIGNSNITYAYSTFKCTTCTLDYVATGNSNVLNLDVDDVDDTGWWLDIDITGNSNIVHIDDNNDYVIRNFNVDLDIVGDSNDILFKQGPYAASNHYLYVYAFGDSNDIEYQMNNSTGQNTTSNAAVGHYTSHNHGSVGDPNLVSIDFWIIGSGNEVHAYNYGTNNYMLVEITGSGADNKLIGYSPWIGSYPRMTQVLDNNLARLRVSGSNNTFGLFQNGGDNDFTLYQNTSGSNIQALQTNGDNTGTVNVYGDSIYDYTLSFTQTDSGTCSYSFDRSTQTADLTVTHTNCSTQ